MLSMIIWVVVLAVAVSGVSLAAALESHEGHLLATSLVTIGILATAVAEHRHAAEQNKSAFVLAALGSRYIGLMWAWAGVSACVVYGLVLEWADWPYAVLAMFLVCVAHMLIAFMLDREASYKVGDARALWLLSGSVKALFSLAVVMLAGLFAFRNAAVFSEADGEGWVAFNLAICTAAGMLSLTGYLLLFDGATSEAGATRKLPS